MTILGIELESPKTPQNVGSIIRLAGCYGASYVNIKGYRLEKSLEHISTNTNKDHRRIPVFFDSECYASNAKIVVVELVEGAECLTTFEHPKNAVYVFGAEDGHVSKESIARADAIVKVPTAACLNLATCVATVLYDRKLKQALRKETL
jgi:tRNA(Leu) C34 or U34 (ribose-2'-O)-methylase TrmL